MSRPRHRFLVLATGATLVGGSLTFVAASGPKASAAPPTATVGLRSLSPSELGISTVAGVTFDSARGRVLVTNDRGDEIASIDGSLDPAREPGLEGAPNPRTFSYDPRGGRVTGLAGGEVVGIDRRGNASRRPVRAGLTQLVAGQFDAGSGEWIGLDRGGTRLVIFDSAPDAAGAAPRVVDLRNVGRGRFQAVAHSPRDGLTYVLGDQLYGLDGNGTVQRSYPLDSSGLRAPTSMVFAPSSDSTDAPETVSLFVVDQGGAASSTQLVEVQTDAVVALALVGSSLVRTVNTSSLSPPSPDSAGVVYLPGQDRLMLSDSEVDEMTIFQNVNLYKMTRLGALVDTGVTTSFSNEPTGVGYIPQSNVLLVSDDDANRISLVAPGGDGRHGTGDDSITSFGTNGFGNSDAEDVTYHPGLNTIFIVDGVNREVYRIQPNANGFNGTAPAGDDTVTSFDVGVHGALDPEGIAYDSATGNLMVIDHSPRIVFEVTVAGALVNTYDVSAAANSVKLAGITLAPASDGSGATRFYIVDRGVDNDGSPNENDGRMYEMTIPGAGQSNVAPVVNAGAEQSITLPAAANVAATVTDDGLPNPPATVTTSWSQVSGPGTVTFGSASALSTTASFSAAGTYVLRLRANDSALTGFDDIQVNVAPADGLFSVVVPVIASSDDAEQNNATGAVSVTNGDLELGVDGPVAQTVGVRFSSVSVPAGAVVQDAYVQFTADETRSVAASLVVRGQAADNPSTFTTATNNVSSRPVTASLVNWNPPSWTVIGQAGPAERTPNLTGIVQEIVNRPGWAQGQAMAFIVTGTNKRTAEPFDGGAALAPRLHIDYTNGGPPPNQPPVVNAGANQSITLPASANVAATVTEDGLPNPPATVTTTWSQVSGPGTVTFGSASALSTTASFSAAGTYVLRLTANDSALTGFDDIQISVAPSGGLFSIDVAISANNNDAEEIVATGAVDLSSSDLELVTEGSTTVQVVGLRFTAVPIPAGAQIVDAYVQFTVDETNSAAATITVQAQAADTAAAFATAAFNISSRSRTTAASTWTPPVWTVIGQAGVGQRTPSLASVIQEVVTRPGWASGNAIGLILTGSGRRTAEALESGAALAPRLHVEYTLS